MSHEPQTKNCPKLRMISRLFRLMSFLGVLGSAERDEMASGAPRSRGRTWDQGWPPIRHGILRGDNPQISPAYSLIVRSLENLPTRAVFMIAFLPHASRSR